MPTPTDRRALAPRRQRAEPSEGLQRRKARRTGERRSLPRAFKRMRLLCQGEELTAEYLTELSLEGVSFQVSRPLASSEVELRFRLADMMEELALAATVLRVQALPEDQGSGLRVHVRFAPLELKQELGLARFLQSEARLAESINLGV
jgi:hypothetical protein